MSSASIQKPLPAFTSTRLRGPSEDATLGPSDQLAVHSHNVQVGSGHVHNASFRYPDRSGERGGRLRTPSERAAVDRGFFASENRTEVSLDGDSTRKSGSVVLAHTIGREAEVGKRQPEAGLEAAEIMLAGPSMEQRKSSAAHLPEVKSLPGFDRELEQQSPPQNSQQEQSASRQRKGEEDEEPPPAQQPKPQRPPLAPSPQPHKNSEHGKRSLKMDVDLDGHVKDEKERSILAQEKMDDEDEEDEDGEENEDRRPSTQGENVETKRSDRRPPPGTWGSHGRASCLSESRVAAGDDGPAKGGSFEMRRQNGSGRGEEGTRGADKEEGRSPGLSGSETSGGENKGGGAGATRCCAGASARGCVTCGRHREEGGRAQAI